jgi:hypothetical protein
MRKQRGHRGLSRAASAFPCKAELYVPLSFEESVMASTSLPVDAAAWKASAKAAGLGTEVAGKSAEVLSFS